MKENKAIMKENKLNTQTLYLFAAAPALFIFLLSFLSPEAIASTSTSSSTSSSPSSTPKVKKLIASNDLPLEFQYLIESIQTYELTPGERKNLHDLIKNFDQYAKLLPVNHLFFIIKSEIYKGVLNTSWEESANHYKMDNRSIQMLNEKLLQNFSSYHSFSKWLIESIQSDIWDLSSTLNLDPTSEKSSQSSPVGKSKLKLKLLYPWFELILHNDPKNFNHRLRPVLINILDKINFSVYLLGRYTRLKMSELPPLEGNFYYFEEREMGPQQAGMVDEKDDFAHYQKLKRLEAEKTIKNLTLSNDETPRALPGEVNSSADGPQQAPQANKEWVPK